MSEIMNGDKSYMTFGGHLDVLRKVLIRIIIVVVLLAIVVFLNKAVTFNIILAPGKNDFVTFRLIDSILKHFGFSFSSFSSHFELISTDLSAQFMTHIYVSCLVAVLIAAPYIIFEVFRFVSPALYESEKKYLVGFAFAVFLLYLIGVLMSYYILMPISFQFLFNYQVDDCVKNTITLESYISTFSTLILIMGIVFQLPVLLIILNKFGFVSRERLTKYRPYVFIIILIISAIITPPDIFTLTLVAIPIYALFEFSLFLLKNRSHKVKELI